MVSHLLETNDADIRNNVLHVNTAFREAYTSDNGEIRGELDASLKGYKTVLSSKSNEETLVHNEFNLISNCWLISCYLIFSRAN